MEAIHQLLLKHKTNVKPSTAMKYARSLNTLANKLKMKPQNDIFDYNKFTDFNKVCKVMSDKSETYQASMYSACVVLLCTLCDINQNMECEDAILKYRNKIKKVATSVKNEYKQNKKSIKQDMNWIPLNELQEQLIPPLEERVKHMIRKSRPVQTFSIQDQTFLNEYVMGLLYCGKYFPLTRLELGSCKVISYDEYTKLDTKSDNYVVLRRYNKTPSFISLNKYKTEGKGVHGENVIELPTELLDKLKAVFKASMNSKLLFPKPSNPTESVSNQKLGLNITSVCKRILNKGITSQLLRNIYITHHYPLMKNELEREELAKKMMTSVDMMRIVYSKEDESE